MTDAADRLERLGRRHKQLLQQIGDLKPELHESMRAARDAGKTWQDIMEKSGYRTIQQVRVICGAAKPGRKDSKS